MNEEQRAEANRLGYDRLKEPPEVKEPPEGMSEKKKKTKAEAVERRLEVIGVISFWGSPILGMGLCSANISENELPTDADLLSIFRIWLIGAGAWLLCFLARYILKGVTDEAKKERPNTMGRLGQALHWWGVAIGGVLLLFGAVGIIYTWGFPEDGIKALGLGVAIFCVARTARYILKGD
jgi:hypothetical protein